MLNEQQLEILSDVIRPLFQSLERDVIMDIARRIEDTMTYTQTAEVMAAHMQQLGYSPNKIRAEVMKVLKADKEYKKAVEENTREYKKEIKKLMDEYTQEAKNVGNEVIKNAAQISWNEDLSLWKSAGKTLSDNSFLHQLQNAIAEQTVEEFVNLTRTTGFKTMSGYESIGNAFRNELDKAAIKICTGTFSQDKVISDVVHNLAKSGLRSIDYASGYSMQLDTAVKNALRTGCAQISAKIMDENIQRTGENLVYVSKHWGARNKGIGVDNHELWQGQVYFIKPGKDYSEEAKRIGQDRIMDIWYSTGYSPDGSHVNDPLGLHGYYCRHTHRVWFEGISSLPDKQEEPAPVEINGKTYDYYAMTQKQRAMERNIRALKRERIARNDLKLPTTEINKRIKQKIREYEEFCEKYNMPEDANRFRMDSKAVDITKTKAYHEYEQLKKKAIEAPVIKDKQIQKAYDDFSRMLMNSSGNEKLVNNMLMYQETTSIDYDSNLKSAFAYRPQEDRIVFNTNAPNYELYDMNYIQSHELAHRMDIKEYHSWNIKEFQDAIDISKQKVYDNLEEIKLLYDLGGKYRYDMATSDIISALSDGELNDLLSTTHDIEYWMRPRNKSLEVFANLCSIEVNQYSSKEVIQKMFPELLEVFERML